MKLLFSASFHAWEAKNFGGLIYYPEDQNPWGFFLKLKIKNH